MGDEAEEKVYGIVYDGQEESQEFVSNDGKATASFANGDVYTGNYVSQKREGNGKYVFASGAEYEGEYKEGVREGQGTMQYPDGSKYVGKRNDPL